MKLRELQSYLADINSIFPVVVAHSSAMLKDHPEHRF